MYADLIHPTICGIYNLTFCAGDPAMSQERDKSEHLRKRGTLNRHPERVRDPLFLSEPFFDPHDLVQVRYEMLRRVDREGMSISQSARAFGVSRPTWYQAAKAFKDGGLPALVPDRPGPRRAHKLDDDVLQALIEARQATPDITTSALVELVHTRFGRSVHRRSIERALKRAQKKTSR